MSLLRQIARGLRALMRRNEADRDVDDELRQFLDESEAAHVARGLTATEARRAATLDIGNVTVAREQIRTSGWEHVVETTVADARYAFRGLVHHPAFTTAAVITLALGIGASTAVFSAVNPILIEPLPFPHADRIVTIDDRNPQSVPMPRASVMTAAVVNAGWCTRPRNA
jgi:putative ABC transport system permease protein